MCGGMFSNKRTQQQATSSNQSGSTENNLWDNPQLQQFLSGYNQQYAGAGNFNVPLNPYQTGAADAQAQVPGNLNPAFATASQIGSDGITQASIDKYMSPYIKGVVDPTMAAQDMQNKAALSNLGGNQAARGALGNNTGSGAAYMAGVQPQQQAQIAGLYQQGYGQAVQTAGQDAALRLQGAGTLGTLTNVATGANTALGGMGQNIWQSNFQNAMTPYSLYNQGVQGFTGFGNLAGTNYSGKSSGTSNGTASETPSLGSIIAGLAGTAMSAYSDERVKDDIKQIGQTFDGQPIYKFRYKGSPMTQIGLMAQDVEQRDPGAVGSDHGIKTVEYDRATKGAERASGGPVNESQSESLIDKVLKASHALRSFRDGGSAPGFAAGGMPGYDPSWNTQTVATPTSSFDFKGAGGDLSKMGSSLGKMGPDDNSGLDAIAKQQQALTQGIQGIMPRYSGGVVPGYDDGGEVYGPAMDGNPEYGPSIDGNREYGPAFSGGDQSYGPSYIPSPKPPADAYFPPQSNLPNRNPMTAYQSQPSASVMGAESSMGPTASSGPAQPKSLGSQFYEMIGSPFSTGVWKGDQITPMQRAGAALTQIGNGPFAGVGQHILGQQKMRLDEMAAERAAGELLGKYNNQPTLHGRTVALAEARSPSDIKLAEAQAEKARVDADKDYQRKLGEDKARFEADLAVEKMQKEWDVKRKVLTEMEAEDARKRSSGTGPDGNTRYRWVPSAPAVAAPAPPPVAAPSAAPSAPAPSPRADRNSRGVIIKGTAGAPYDRKDQAGFGEYYRGSDGGIYRRATMRNGVDTLYNGAP